MRILYLKHPGPLTALSEACLALSPRIALFPHALFLDLGITEKAWKGEVRQRAALQDILDAFGIRPQVVIADRAAWAPAFAVGEGRILPPGESQTQLHRLPIERLPWLGTPDRAEAEQKERDHLTSFMRRVGIATIADFLRLRPEAILRRFGKIGVGLLHLATGTQDIPIPTFASEDPLTDTIETDEIFCLEQLLFIAQERWTRLEARLIGRGLLAQEVRMTFQFDGSPELSRQLKLAEPLRETKLFVRLLRDYLDDMTWESPLTELTIHIPQTVPFRAGQLSLFDDELKLYTDMGQYVSRLRARYGETAVGFADLKPSHLPERSFALSWPPATSAVPKGNFPERPLFLFDPPRPYTADRRGHWQPTEVLAAEWWRNEGDRHYFIHHTPEGLPLWVYWDTRQQQWFLHGTFD